MNYLTLLAEKGYVEFPNIFTNHGIKIPVSEVAFSLFGKFDVRWYGIIISFGIVLCIVLALLSCEKHQLSKDDLLDYLIFAIPSAIIGARVYYVAFNFSEYEDNLKKVFAYWEGGLAVYGGIIAAVIAVFCVAKHKKQPFLRVMDFGIGYIALGQAIGRWGNFFNQEAYGTATTLPWGMTGSEIAEEIKLLGYRSGTLVHPTFLYESLWCLIVFIVIMIYRNSKLKKTDGECLCLYMMLYGLERVFVEGLRTDSLYIGNTSIRVSQLVSAILIILGITLFIDIRRKYSKKVYEESISSSFGNVVADLSTEEQAEAAEAVEPTAAAEPAALTESIESAETAAPAEPENTADND